MDTNMMDRSLRRAPRLLAAYLRCSNRAQRSLFGLAGLVAAVGSTWLIVTAVLWTQRDTAAVVMSWISENRWWLAGVLGVLASSLVSRRRAGLQAARAHDWLAALPVARSIERCEKYAFALPPAAKIFGLLWVGMGSVGVVMLLGGSEDVTRSLSACRDLSAGVLAGAVFGMLMPLPREMSLPPGSRYVPHRLAGSTTAVRPSTRGLGFWPIRHMFASARPKSVAHATVPLLLIMPVGARADFAMLTLGAFALFGATCLLTIGMVAVSGGARRWLKPLPLSTAHIARAILLPSLAFAATLGSVQAWLLWLLMSASSEHP